MGPLLFAYNWAWGPTFTFGPWPSTVEPFGPAQLPYWTTSLRRAFETSYHNCEERPESPKTCWFLSLLHFAFLHDATRLLPLQELFRSAVVGLRRCLCACWIRMLKFSTNQRLCTWTSMLPRVCRTFWRPTSAPKAPLRCNLPFENRAETVWSCWVCVFCSRDLPELIYAVCAISGLSAELEISSSRRMGTLSWRKWQVLFSLEL